MSSSTDVPKKKVREDRRFGLGPLNVVLEKARGDVDALFRAYENNSFSRWQLKMAIKERLDPKPLQLHDSHQRMILLLLAHEVTPVQIKALLNGTPLANDNFGLVFDDNSLLVTYDDLVVDFDLSDTQPYVDLLGLDDDVVVEETPVAEPTTTTTTTPAVAKPTRRRFKRQRLTNGTRHPGFKPPPP